MISNERAKLLPLACSGPLGNLRLSFNSRLLIAVPAFSIIEVAVGRLLLGKVSMKRVAEPTAFGMTAVVSFLSSVHLISEDVVRRKNLY